MKAVDQIPRRALLWLILCQFVVVLPHLGRVPVWVLAVYGLAALWRLQIHRQRWPIPGRWLRLMLGLCGGGAILASYRTLIGLEPMVALLLVANGLKLLETLRDKDGYVLVSLAFFICVTEFLFSQELPIVLYSVVCTVLLVTCMITLNQRPGADFSKQEPILALKMLGLAIPLMVVIFILFPRIGPLWSVPSKNGQGTTGMSDFLRPGEVSKLGRSAAVAFRVQFEQSIPPKPALYWRGMVLSAFDDGAWRTLSWRDHPADERQFQRPVTYGDPLRYRVIMEPTMQRWLYALPFAESPSAGIIEAWDNRLTVLTPVESQLGYEVNSWLDAAGQTELSPWRRSLELAFPSDLNPRARAWITQQARAVDSPQALVQRVLRHFREQPFYYTLEPPPISEDDFVDVFLFESRRGFCEHYAYAFVALMRMAGIPARIIGGYQGGEINPVNNTVVVRQFDAHAWAEVWFENEGWVRIDPTGAVSPARVEFGLEAALAGEEGFLADSPLSAYRFKGINVVNWLRLRYDAMAFQWQSFIVGFNSDKQLDLLKDWFGEIRVSWFVAVLLGSGALVLIPLTLWINYTRRVSNRLPVEQDFAALCLQLEKYGVVREHGESPYGLLERANSQIPNDHLLAEIQISVRKMYELESGGN